MVDWTCVVMSPKYSDRSIFEKSSIWNSVDVNPRQSALAGPSSVANAPRVRVEGLELGPALLLYDAGELRVEAAERLGLLNASDQGPFVRAVRAQAVAPARRVHYGRLEVFLAAAP